MLFNLEISIEFTRYTFEIVERSQKYFAVHILGHEFLASIKETYNSKLPSTFLYLSPVRSNDANIVWLDPKQNVFPDQMLHDECLIKVGERFVIIFVSLRSLEEVTAARVHKQQTCTSFGTRCYASEIR